MKPSGYCFTQMLRRRIAQTLHRNMLFSLERFCVLSAEYVCVNPFVHLQYPELNRDITAKNHSLRKDFTGLASAAFMLWKLTVKNATAIAPAPAATNITRRELWCSSANMPANMYMKRGKLHQGWSTA